jgi:hypothetical protein
LKANCYLLIFAFVQTKILLLAQDYAFNCPPHMKSQKLGAEGESDECLPLCIDFACKAQEVMEAAKSLDEADRHEIEQLGYSAFLNLKLGPISQRKETYVCMKKVDLEEDRIKVQLRNDVILYIRPDEIHHLLMVPQGPKAPLKSNKQQHKEFQQLRSELGLASLETGKILMFMKKEENKHLRVKCFFLILFSRFLLPTSSQRINAHAVMYTKDLASLKEFDMCTIVYEHLRECIKAWKNQRQGVNNKTSLTMPGCPIIILVSILVLSSITSCIFGFGFFLPAQLVVIFGFFLSCLSCLLHMDLMCLLHS